MATAAEFEALRLIDREIQRSRRNTGVRLSPTFVRSADTYQPPPLVRLAGAGRSGEVRLKLFLTFALRATRGRPTLHQRPPHTLAAMLALPSRTGPRRVSDALRWLERNDFLQASPRTGEAPDITLLDGGDPPAELAKRGSDGFYISLPLELWSSGVILHMRARELAVYAALTELTVKLEQEGTLTTHRKRQYGLSDDTWTRALAELRKRRLVSTRRAVDDGQENPRRTRMFYKRLPPTDWRRLR